MPNKYQPFFPSNKIDTNNKKSRNRKREVCQVCASRMCSATVLLVCSRSVWWYAIVNQKLYGTGEHLKEEKFTFPTRVSKNGSNYLRLTLFSMTLSESTITLVSFKFCVVPEPIHSHRLDSLCCLLSWMGDVRLVRDVPICTALDSFTIPRRIKSKLKEPTARAPWDPLQNDHSKGIKEVWE